jgi:hypothetical protein
MELSLEEYILIPGHLETGITSGSGIYYTFTGLS